MTPDERRRAVEVMAKPIRHVCFREDLKVCKGGDDCLCLSWTSDVLTALLKIADVKMKGEKDAKD